MTSPNTQELQIVRVFSAMEVPERIIRDSNIKELLNDMVAEQEAVQSDAKRLERLRKEKEDGNLITNLLNGRSGKIEEAHLDLNQSIGRLTQKSSQLLIVNTAISKVLNDQQHILLEQQRILKHQADELKDQNFKIFEQQHLLAKQQQEINQANQGLLEAKGITQEQAQQLVGCVRLVKEAEGRISSANQALKLDVEQSLQESSEQVLERVSVSFANQEQRNNAFEQQVMGKLSNQFQETQDALESIGSEIAQFKSVIQEQLESNTKTLGQQHELFEKGLKNEFSVQAQQLQNELSRFSSDSAEFKAGIGRQLQEHIDAILKKNALQDATAQKTQESLGSLQLKQEEIHNEQAQAIKAIDDQLSLLQAEQQKADRRNRFTVVGVAILAVASLGWQLAQHFALV